MRVLIANELRSYREALAEALRHLRPEAEVVTAEPEGLESRVSRFAPHVVVCDRATGTVHALPSWIELYPGYGSRSVVSARSERREVAEIQLSDLLDLVDQVDLAQQS
jgi:hypothetical protein